MYYYVSRNGAGPGTGSADDPFRTIGQAADIAMPGDTVIIGDGIYREWVDPKNGGTGNNQRITYRAAENAHPVISGAEVIGDWVPVSGTVWRAEVDNRIFSGVNPYAQEVFGDWFDGLGQTHHTGELFLDGNALFEAPSLEALFQPAADPAKTPRWFAQAGECTTVFHADFGGGDPNAHATEISARACCFFPRKEGLGYITVSGLTLCQAATQWAPPTAFQPGIIGPNWSKGWIIENCKIHDSKCAGVSLGKKRDTKDNRWSKNPAKGGSQTYTEMVFQNLQDGWCREKVGGHIVRNNEIYNCGQAGIVGCMGGAFSDITGNHIHHINVRGEVSGAEMAGIKLHAAVDTVIEGNVIHHCVRGLWLDWQAQGAAVRRNAFFENNAGEDLFIEVCHGPCLVENNIFLSDRCFLNVSQGTACVHNLFAGKVYAAPDTNRFTLYHRPHSTMVGGVMLVYGGDDRFQNNLFLDLNRGGWQYGVCGTDCYREYSHEAAGKTLENDTPMADVGRTLPVIARDNGYYNGDACWAYEENPRILRDFHAELSVTEEDGHFWLKTNLGDGPALPRGQRITTALLGQAFQSEQAFENRDGSPVRVDKDFLGAPRGEHPAIGPFENVPSRIRLV